MLDDQSDYSTTCLALTHELCRVTWPKKFRSHVPSRYDGKYDPRVFLRLYNTAVEIAGGDDKCKDNYLPMVLKHNIRQRLIHLTASSISSWPKLCNKFVGAF